MKKTVTIGIPAHNEEKNIAKLLDTILMQQGDNFTIDQIIVACDGCTDDTAKIVKEYHKKSKLIRLIDDGQRIGQSGRLSEFYVNLPSDIFVTFDGDILLVHNKVIYELVKAFTSKKVGLVGGRKIVSKPTTLMGKIQQTYEYFWLKVIDNINDGNNLHNHQGPVSAASREFISRINIPRNIVASDHFLYFKAIEAGYEFRLAKKAEVYFKVPATLKDFFNQSARFSTSADSIRKYFGSWTDKHYYIPNHLKRKAYLATLVKSPVYLILALVLQITERIVNSLMPNKNNGSIWAAIQSSK